MMRPFTALTCLVVMSFLTTPAGEIWGNETASVEFFEKKIRPVLVEHCYECHSAAAAAKNKLQGGLLLDSRDVMRKGGDTGEAIVPGKPEEGLLLASLRYDGDYQMPPKGKLPEAVLADFEKWIRDGAVDPREATAEVEAKPTIDWRNAREHWAYQPPRDSSPPPIKHESWAKSPLDRFVVAKLEEQGLEPVAPADARTLLRRMHFDLIGLPPTPEEVAAFETAFAQDRQAAVEALMERLLASPHYGERWARHWLDVARYAQDQAHTFGVRPKTNAFQYRDWVIEALNNDLPYDQFVKLQIAGDLLPTVPTLRGEVYASAQHPPQAEAFTKLAGMGFLGLGAEYYKNSDKARAEADELDDRIDTLTRGFLGLTVSCARCHDHKFDPIPTRDYYALAGIFAGSNLSDAPLVGEDVVQAYNQGQQQIKQQDERIKEWLQAHQRDRGRQEAALTAKYITAAWRIEALKQAKANYSLDEITKHAGLQRYFLDRWVKYFSANNAEKSLATLKPWYAHVPSGDAGTTYDAVSVPAEVEQAAAAFQTELLAAIEAWQAVEADYQRELAAAQENAKQQVKRRALEKPQESLLKTVWLDDQAPLAINAGEFEKQFLAEDDKPQLAELRAELDRIKQAAPPPYPAAPVLKGGGKTLQVFVRGNPAVLGDWAARSFLQILTGEEPTTDPEKAKQQQFGRLELAEAIADPNNPLTARVIVNRVWRAHFGRGLVETPSNFGRSGESPSHPELLDWLALRFIENGWSLKWLHREIMLSSTYQLSSASSAANAEKDGANKYYWRMDRRRLDVEAWRDNVLEVSGTLDRTLGGPAFDLSDASAKRRTVYARISRHELDNLLRLFDFPDANVTADRRTVTTVPQQQLFVLNSDFMISQAKSFAKRIEAAAADDVARVQFAYRLAFGRAPTEQESQLAAAFLTAAPTQNDKLTAWEQYTQALLASNEMLYID